MPKFMPRWAQQLPGHWETQDRHHVWLPIFSITWTSKPGVRWHPWERVLLTVATWYAAVLIATVLGMALALLVRR